MNFLQSARINAQATKRFFQKFLNREHNKQPRVINLYKDKIYPQAIEKLKKEKILDNDGKLR